MDIEDFFQLRFCQLLTTLSSSLRCESSAEHHTAGNTPRPNMLEHSYPETPSALLSWVNAVDWGWTVHYLVTIILLILLAFSFIPHRSNHSLTLFRSRFIDSVMATLSLWYIGSDIWFQDYRWEASLLCFQSSFSKTSYLESWRVFHDISFLGDAFGVLSCQFWSTVLQCGARQSVVPGF